MTRPRATLLGRVAGLAVSAVGVGFLLRAALTMSDEVLAQLGRADPLPFLIGLALLAAQSVTVVVLWRELLGLFGEAASFPQSYRLLYRAAVGKYLPGRVWALAGVAVLAGDSGVGSRAATLATTATVVVVAAAGAVVGGLAYLVWATALPLEAAAGAALASMAGLAVPAVAGRSRRSRRAARGAAVAVGGWLLVAAGHWAIARAVHPVAPSDVLPLVASAALAWLAGLLAVAVPAGLGVREGVQALALTGVLSTPTATAFVLLVRASLVLIDLLSAAVAWTLRPPAAAPTRAPLPPH